LLHKEAKIEKLGRTRERRENMEREQQKEVKLI
jgi:hypothetical protein